MTVLASTSLTAADALAFHEGGKLEVVPRVPLRDRRDLSLAYTPGVADVCRAIAADARRGVLAHSRLVQLRALAAGS